MDGRTSPVADFGRSRRRVGVTPALVAAAVAGLTLTAAPAAAGPIRGHHLHRVHAESTLGPAWGRFLSGGPALWAVARSPRIPSGSTLLSQNGRLVETPFVDYLLWRRSLNPARFDHYHPFLGPALGSLLPPPTTPTRPTPGGRTGGGPPPVNPQPQNGVPEPGSILVGLVLASAALASRPRHPRAA